MNKFNHVRAECHLGGGNLGGGKDVIPKVCVCGGSRDLLPKVLPLLPGSFALRLPVSGHCTYLVLARERGREGGRPRGRVFFIYYH